MKINLLNSKIHNFIIFTIITLGIYAIYCGIALQADGSYFLLTILDTQKYLHVNNSRFFSTLITQTPLILAIKLGLTSLNVYIYLYGFGLVAIPLIFWIASLFMLRGSNLFWLFLLGFCATYLSSGLFAIGEFHLCYSVCAFATALLLVNELNFLKLVLVTISSLILSLSYEAMIFLGPLLFSICIIRAVKDPKKSHTSQIWLFLSAFLFAASFAVSAWSVVYPRDPAVLNNAMQLGWIFKSKHFAYLFGMTALLAITLTYRSVKVQHTVILTALLASGFYVTHPNFWNTALFHYQTRSISGLCLFALIMSCAWYSPYVLKSHKMNSLINFNNASFTILLVYISLSLVFLFKLNVFYDWARKFEKEAINITTSTPINHSRIYDTGQTPSEFEAGWTQPCMSILLRGNAEAVLLNNTNYGGWQPFQPEKITKNPLERYKKLSNFFN